MDHVPFTDQDIATANRITAGWLNPVNNFVYQGKNPSFVASTGPVNAYVVTLPFSTLAALEDGQEIAFKVTLANTGPATLEVVGAGSTGVLPLQSAGVALIGGELVPGSYAKVVHLNGVWNLGGGTSSGVVTNLTVTGNTILGGDVLFEGAVTFSPSATIDLPAGSVVLTDLSSEVITFITSQASGGGGGGGAGGILSGTGFISFQSGVPNMQSNVVGATSHFYVPSEGSTQSTVFLNDGSDNFEPVQVGELTQALADATKSPGASASDRIYHIFLWDDAGTVRATRGPPWNTETDPGAGAGTSELEKRGTTWVNKFAIVNGPAAGMGTCAGCIRTNGANQLDWILGGPGAGGVAVWLALHNIAGGIEYGVGSKDSTFNWTLGTNNVPREMDGSSLLRVSFLSTLDNHITTMKASCSYSNAATPTVDVAGRIGIGLDSTTVFDPTCVQARAGANGTPAKVMDSNLITEYQDFAGRGWHFLQAMEVNETSAGGSTSTFGGGAYGAVGIYGKISA